MKRIGLGGIALLMTASCAGGGTRPTPIVLPDGSLGYTFMATTYDRYGESERVVEYANSHDLCNGNFEIDKIIIGGRNIAGVFFDAVIKCKDK